MEDLGNVMLDTLLRRRTVRKYTDADISNEDVEKLLRAAMFAPTRLGKRPWHFMVVRDPEIKRTVISKLASRGEFTHAPVMIAVLAEHLSPEWDLDSAAATENILVAATALGIGSAWVSSKSSPTWDDASAVFTELAKIPRELGLVSLILLGHPAGEVKPHTVQDVYEQHRVHFERWGNTRGE